MTPTDFKLFDWHRFFIGSVPGSFFIEVIFRTVIVYVILILSIRLMGKRMALQLNVSEMTAMVTLAAAIGIPIQTPDKGILPAVVIAIVVVLTERIVSGKAAHNQKFEEIVHGDVNVLIVDSVINFNCVQHAGLSRLLIFEQVRAHGFHHLGQVKRMYLESSGAFSIIEEESRKPGLSVIPLDDADYWKESEKASQVHVCGHCGANPVTVDNLQLPCNSCLHLEWVTAVC